MTLHDLEPEIRRAAKVVAFQWPGVVDADDVAQEIALRLLESPGSLEKVSEMNDKARYRAIIGIGHQIASQERTDYDYFKGSYNYAVGDLKDLLKMGILVDPPPNFRTEFIDMEDALHEMKERVPQYVEAIRARYEKGVVPTANADQQRLKNALASLADSMNKVARRRFSERDDGVGTRKPVRREAARFLSKDGYDNDSAVLPSHLRNNATEPEIWE